MKRIFSIVSIFILIGLISTSCLKNPDNPYAANKSQIDTYVKEHTEYKEDSLGTGMYFAILTNGTGKKADTLGHLTKFYYTISDLQGTKYYELAESTGKYNSFIYGGVYDSIFTLPISKMRGGDKASFILPSNLGFGGNSVGNIPAYTVLKLDIYAVDVLNQADQLAQIKLDNNFDNSLDTTTATKLVFQKILKNDSTKAVKSLAKVAVSYTGKLGYPFYKDDGNGGTTYDAIFDQGDSAVFTLNVSGLIPGFEEALKLMNIGEKAKFIIPYDQAYGAAGSQPVIPGYSWLYFEAEVKSGE